MQAVNNSRGVWRDVWSGLAPLRMEVFCWQVIHEGVAVKQELVRRGMITTDQLGVLFARMNQNLCDICFFTVRTFGRSGCDGVASGAKARWRLEYGVVMDNYRCPQLGKVMMKAMKERLVEEWCKPAAREMKFNVDGAAQGCPGESGIRGVLRDNQGDSKNAVKCVTEPEEAA
ncbi:Uncharacterized protein TCM_020852 [Theobroma cacao]|uniref:Reverse transcriptase zinc-binding domain-containing protein n=1 Tax=Theobroma cacao TaxID=3641 RepID=A0A061EMU3_THECC|nr:Uncharacterized protein TCM_020852 [Theobroma cacao]